MVRMTINGKIIEAPEGSTILEAARRNHIYIPSLCYMSDQHPSGSCRICVVEVEGQKQLQASCMTKVSDNMVIQTNTQRVRAARKVLYEM
ncbi:MAG: 2Fe-2S iron-sulfur cluster binding domain-containing protein, partial [Clostridiales bacterium]|nr:2Fe-2S iron-sulfur cluster binding domain-containing protein [Clostridiales bacterium]